MYYFLAIMEREVLDYGDNNWVDKLFIENSELDRTPFTLYVESFYWALATIMLVGSKGTTYFETIFCICTLLCTVGMFAKILSMVAMVMEEMEKKKKGFKMDKETMNTFFSMGDLTIDP